MEKKLGLYKLYSGIRIYQNLFSEPFFGTFVRNLFSEPFFGTFFRNQQLSRKWSGKNPSLTVRRLIIFYQIIFYCFLMTVKKHIYTYTALVSSTADTEKFRMTFVPKKMEQCRIFKFRRIGTIGTIGTITKLKI